MSRSVAGALIPSPFFIRTVQADTSGSTINLGLGYDPIRYFTSSSDITGPVTVALRGASQGREIRWKFKMNAADPMNSPITFPDNWKMSDALFDDNTHQWTAFDNGTYWLEAWYDGQNWNTTITGIENT